MHFLQVAFAIVVVSSATLASPGDNYWGLEGHGYSSQYAYPQYSFDYGVHSAHTGDVKSHRESRHGDLVTGSYRLNDPDGTIRQVDYVADKHNGFNAEVKKIGHSVHPPTVRHHHYGGAGGTHYDATALLYGSGAHGFGGFGLHGGLGYGTSHTHVSQSAGGHVVRGGHLGYGGGGHFGGATSYANGNNMSFGHHGVGRYAAGQHGLGGNSYGHGHAINHFGGGHYGGGNYGSHFGGATSYANGNLQSLKLFGGHHF